MFGSLPNVTLSRPRIVIESLLEHFIFPNFLGGGPPNPPQGKVAAHQYSHHTISTPPPPFTKSYIHPCYDRSVTVYRFINQFDKSMLMCAIIIIKYHKIKQIISDLPKIYPELCLSSSIIKNVTAGLQRFFYLMLYFVSPSQVT